MLYVIYMFIYFHLQYSIIIVIPTFNYSTTFFAIHTFVSFFKSTSKVETSSNVLHFNICKKKHIAYENVIITFLPRSSNRPLSKVSPLEYSSYQCHFPRLPGAQKRWDLVRYSIQDVLLKEKTI